MSEGRGSKRPFEYIGAPYIDNLRWRDALMKLHLPGVTFDTLSFVPVEIANAVSNPKHKGQLCHGVAVQVTDRNVFEPVRTGIAMLKTAHDVAPNDFQFRDRRIDQLTGTPRIRLMISAGISVEEINASWKKEAKKFEQDRAPFLLYR
jgi:beta-N-acetylhexosaminidase